MVRRRCRSFGENYRTIKLVGQINNSWPGLWLSKSIKYLADYKKGLQC